MPVEHELILTKDNILRRISQEQIFEAYLGLPVDTGIPYANPLRLDRRPTCRYYYNSLGKLYFHDFGKFHWDCFAVVQYKYGCSRFTDALRIIARDFQLNNVATATAPTYVPSVHERPTIQVTIREWTGEDLSYWKQFNITLDILNLYNVYPCKAVWLNDKYYRCKGDDPCYCYYFGKDIFKLYFPKRSYNRFFQNLQITDDILQGLEQLPEHVDILVITKSMKDVMSLRSFGVYAVAVHSEYHVIKEELYDTLHNMADYIIALFDRDSTGRILTIKYVQKYNTPFLIFPFSFRKDFTDNVVHLGTDRISEIINITRQKLLTQNGERTRTQDQNTELP